MHIFPSSSISSISNSFIYLSIYFAEFFLYRIVFLVLGIVMLMLAFFLSKSLVFYYSIAMAIGVLLVILMVLFQVVWYLWFSNINVYIYKYIFVIQVFFFCSDYQACKILLLYCCFFFSFYVRALLYDCWWIISRHCIHGNFILLWLFLLCIHINILSGISLYCKSDILFFVTITNTIDMVGASPK